MFYSNFVQTIFVCSCCIIVIEVKVPVDKLKPVPVNIVKISESEIFLSSPVEF